MDCRALAEPRRVPGQKAADTVLSGHAGMSAVATSEPTAPRLYPLYSVQTLHNRRESHAGIHGMAL